MATSSPTLSRKAGRLARSAAVLAATMAVAVPLVGTAPPAMAADDAKEATVDPALYSSEDEIIQAMEKGKDGEHKAWAPIEQSESVMGFPRGIVKGNDAVELDHVKKVYDPKTAVADAKAAAKEYTQDTKNSKASRDLAQEVVDSKFDTPEELQNVESPLDGPGTTVEEHCVQGKSRFFDGKQPKTSPNSCFFVGKVDEKGKYPKGNVGADLIGGGEQSVTTEGQATHEDSTTEGWKVGGKFASKLSVAPPGDKGGTGGDAGVEVNFEYSYSTTATNRVTDIKKNTTTVKFPDGKAKNSLQERRNGAYYLGYIIIPRKETKPEHGKEGYEHLVAVPARVYVQSRHTDSPVTYLKLHQQE